MEIAHVNRYRRQGTCQNCQRLEEQVRKLQSEIRTLKSRLRGCSAEKHGLADENQKLQATAARLQAEVARLRAENQELRPVRVGFGKYHPGKSGARDTGRSCGGRIPAFASAGCPGGCTHWP